ncbi:hypothetical protein [Ornithinimicrobium sp. INDO-MA30-4]|uniref:hypothetical protein n=1 Tax=Ornithinimicrobium sp. INDO-MA30-4 TaxID=2908651 RepID=UPI001F29ECA0|nr:hypothetical protein [Ornithinimicrobium sp. INDO-MA30-4]UJH71174.1 hypothetical protein L0A91_04885 [Ornithinimicrobium sp. INDO-MA30-4]
MDSRGKLMTRRYYIDMALAVQGEDRIDDAVVSIPGDGYVRSNFGKGVVRDLTTPVKERAEGLFPVSLLFGDHVMSWLFDFPDRALASEFNAAVVVPVRSYNIPAIELDRDSTKSAVATVFEKVNTGGLP